MLPSSPLRMKDAALRTARTTALQEEEEKRAAADRESQARIQYLEGFNDRLPGYAPQGLNPSGYRTGALENDAQPRSGEGPTGGPEQDRKSRILQAARKARILQAAKQTASVNLNRVPGSEVPAPRLNSTLEEITGRNNPYNDVPINVPLDSMLEEWRPGRATAFFGNAGNALTFGQLDKIGALPALLPGGETYDEARARARNNLSMAREDYPITSLGGDVTGFLAPGGLIAKGVGAVTRPAVMAAQRVSPAAGFGAKTANAAAQGAVGAGAFGATVGAENQAADQGKLGVSLEDRASTAAEFAPGGALFGAAMPAAGVVLRPAFRAAEGLVAKAGEALKLTPGSAARFDTKVGVEAARRSLERAGILNLDDFLKRAAKYGDKPVVTGELGQDPLNSLVSLVRSKGTTADKAMAVLEERVAGMPGRMLKDIADETGLKPDEVMGQIEDMVKAGRARAAPLYDKAEATPFAPSPNLDRILQAPLMRSLLPKAEGRVANQAVEPYIASPEGMPPIKVFDELKQLLDEEISKRLANSQGIDDVEALRSALVRELDTISAAGADYTYPLQVTAPRSSPYALAREAGGDAPRVQAGLKAGERALSGSKLADDVAREVAAIRGGELTAYQIGVVRNLVKEVENGRLTPKRVSTSAFKKKLNEVFGEPAAQGLIQKFGVEAELASKGARWNPNVGSVTSQAQMGGPSRAGDEIMRAGANALSGNKIGLAQQAINLLRRQGYSEQQLNEMGKVFLASPDEAAGLLYPKQTPTPGAIPPPTPPAGRLRENALTTSSSAVPAARAPNALSDLARDASVGAGTGIFGAATTPEGEDPWARGAAFAAAGALGTRIGSRWAGAIPLDRAQTNAGFPLPKGLKTGHSGPGGHGPKRELAPRDLVLAYNERTPIVDMALEFDLGKAAPKGPRLIGATDDLTDSDIENHMSVLLSNTRKVAQEAQQKGQVQQLAEEWNVTPDELEKFAVLRPRGGGFEQTMQSIADVAEAAPHMRLPEIAERLGLSHGSVKAMLSQARAGVGRLSEETRARINALKFQKGRYGSDTAESGGTAHGIGVGGQRTVVTQGLRRGAGIRDRYDTPPELGGAMVGAGAGAMTDRENPLRGAAIGAAGGAFAGRMARGANLDKTALGSFGSNALRGAERPLPNYVDDATTDSLRQIQREAIDAGRVPPVFKLFRMPDGRIIAWNGDETQGGFSHEQARNMLGLGKARLEHGQFRWGSDLTKTDWYARSGEGKDSRSIEGMMSKGMKKGQDPNDILLDATPDEMIRDLRGIGAMGPGNKMGDYPHRRRLATEGVTHEAPDGRMQDVKSFNTPGGKASLIFGGGKEPTVVFDVDGKTGATNRAGLTTPEAKQTFEKAFAMMEREVIRRGKDAYIFAGSTAAHNRLYAGALQRLGAPQGYVAIVGPDSGTFGLLRVGHYNDLVAQGRIKPSEWNVIRSKRGDTEVPEWRRKTGMFAVPPAVAGVNALAGNEKSPR